MCSWTRTRRVEGPRADLPPTSRLLWWIWVLVLGAALGAEALWALHPPALGLPPVTPSGVQTAAGAAVAATVAVFLSYSIWRLRVEILARRPGPVMVLAFADHTSGHGEPDLAGRLKVGFEQYLVQTRLHGPTAVPSTGAPSDFLTVVEAAGDQLQGVWAAASRFVRLFAPVTAYQVACTLRDGVDAACAVSVEISRLPRTSLAPVVVEDDTWERAVERAAHALAAQVLPQTAECRRAPWTTWAGYRIPVELFHAYQQFQGLRADRFFDAATEQLRTALSHDPGNLAMRLELGKMQERQQMYLDALLTYDDIVTVAARSDRELGRWWAPEGIAGPSWPRSSAVRTLPSSDPAVLVARYRHAMLLGLSEKTAAQWWGRPERCSTGTHLTAREQRRAHLRRALRVRLESRYRADLDATCRAMGVASSDLFGDLTPRQSTDERRLRRSGLRVCFATLAQLEFERLADDYVRPLTVGRLRPSSRARTPAPDDRVFMPWRSHRPSEFSPPLPRRQGRLHRRSGERVLPRAAILSGLPWSALRRAMAVEALGRDLPSLTPSQPLPRPSRLVMRTRTANRADIDVFDGARTVLDAGWPVDPRGLDGVVARLTGGPGSRLRSWRAHFNAACLLSLPLLSDDPVTRSPNGARDVGEPARHAARAAVDELERAVACTDSSFIARQREWLLCEEPDLDQLRGRPEFKDFEARTFGSIGAAVERGPDIHLWQQSAYVARFISVAARSMAELWEARLDGTAVELDRRRWLDDEMSGWRLAEQLAMDPRDARTRQDVARRIARAGRLPELRRPRVAHPRFTDERLDRQIVSMRGGGDTALLTEHRLARSDSVAVRIGETIRLADQRLGQLASVLRADGGRCCAMARPSVLADEEQHLRTRSASWARAGATVRVEHEEPWCVTSRDRWRALSRWFDDETLGCLGLEERRLAFATVLHERWWEAP